ncbi:MAG TPA: regulatory protein RecX [Gemmatimonadaceae bacterium]
MAKTTYDRALNMLSFRARSVSELRRQLLRKGEPAADVEAAIARLLEQRLLNDADYARQFARVKLTGAGASKFKIVQELGRKGIGKPLADEAIESLRQDEGLDASESIHRVAEKKWKTLAKLDEATGRRRLYAFLARRGFNPDEIRGAMSGIGAPTED